MFVSSSLLVFRHPPPPIMPFYICSPTANSTHGTWSTTTASERSVSSTPRRMPTDVMQTTGYIYSLLRDECSSSVSCILCMMACIMHVPHRIISLLDYKRPFERYFVNQLLFVSLLIVTSLRAIDRKNIQHASSNLVRVLSARTRTHTQRFVIPSRMLSSLLPRASMLNGWCFYSVNERVGECIVPTDGGWFEHKDSDVRLLMKTLSLHYRSIYGLYENVDKANTNCTDEL